MILVGEEDYATPVAMAEALRSAIAGADMMIVPGGRRLTPLEMPRKIADELAELLR